MCSVWSSARTTIRSTKRSQWGVRSIGHDVTVRAEGDLEARAVADIFPAYDEDGGMLLVLTPES